MKKILVGVVILVVIAAFAIFSKQFFKHDDVHYHAGFQIYKDGKLVNFSDFKYMHEKPCTVDGKPAPDEHDDEQFEKAHLHDQTGDVVHVHRKAATWNDLFLNIKYPIDKKAVGYINGEKLGDFLSQEIKPYDSLVIFVGKHADDSVFLKKAVKKEYIQKVEKKSETCSS